MRHTELYDVLCQALLLMDKPLASIFHFLTALLEGRDFRGILILQVFRRQWKKKKKKNISHRGRGFPL